MGRRIVATDPIHLTRQEAEFVAAHLAEFVKSDVRTGPMILAARVARKIRQAIRPVTRGREG